MRKWVVSGILWNNQSEMTLPKCSRKIASKKTVLQENCSPGKLSPRYCPFPPGKLPPLTNLDQNDDLYYPQIWTKNHLKKALPFFHFGEPKIATVNEITHSQETLVLKLYKLRNPWDLRFAFSENESSKIDKQILVSSEILQDVKF